MTSQSKDPPAVAALIRQRLKAKGWEMKDLAAALGYVNAKGQATSYTYNLLTGTQPLSRRQLSLMLEVLELTGDAGDDAYFAEGWLPPDIEERLKSDRAYLAAVRRLT